VIEIFGWVWFVLLNLNIYAWEKRKRETPPPKKNQAWNLKTKNRKSQIHYRIIAYTKPPCHATTIVTKTNTTQNSPANNLPHVTTAHYPSIRHFADMSASEDYQAVNHKHRVGSLRDTCILCTSELELPPPASASDEKAKL